MRKGGHSIDGVTDAVEAIACNQDLLTQILICLPPKPLIRFKCVSKGWFSFPTLISVAATPSAAQLASSPASSCAEL